MRPFPKKRSEMRGFIEVNESCLAQHIGYKTVFV
jgi:hypothetical protein